MSDSALALKTGPAAAGRQKTWHVALPFIAAVFVGAFVLFLVEPMVGKMLLPLAGGTAAIWTTTVLFFQATLTLGYLYSHFISRHLLPRAQVALHLVLMVVAIAVLPIALHLPGSVPRSGTPVFWLLAVLSLSVGLPFLIVSTTSPLLQRWLSATRHAQSIDPYRLYQASNLGSMAALLAYPSVVEMHLGIASQQRLWTVGYLLLIALTAYCAALMWRGRVFAHTGPEGGLETGFAKPRARVGWANRARWAVLAAVPSVWMLGVTSYFTTSVRPLPLLWVVPLAIYLLTLAMVFGRRPIRIDWLNRAFPLLAVPLLGFTVLGGQGPFWFLAAFHLGVFMAGALICHARLASERPHADQLTHFYLWLSIGGAIGGVFAGLIAPFAFNDYLEYPLAIVAACFLRPIPEAIRSRVRMSRDLLVGAGLVACLAAVAGVAALTGGLSYLEKIQLSAAATGADLLRALLVLAVPAVAAVAFSRNHVRFGGAAAAVLILSLLPIGSRGTVIYQARDFYGVHTVATDNLHSRHLLLDGVTIHGVQLEDPALRDTPTGYYSATGPMGDVFRLVSERASRGRVGVIGLGAGGLSCYASPGQRWTYFELDPKVQQIAQDPRYFTYLRDCPGAGTDVVIGDGRLSLAADRGSKFDLLVLDAFGGDAPPTHLLTREAIQLYLDHLAPGGLIVFNVSNRYLDLTSVLSAAATSMNLAALERVDPDVTPTQAAAGKYPSDWFVMAPSAYSLVGLSEQDGWVHPRPNRGQRVWTDDYSDVLAVTRF